MKVIFLLLICCLYANASFFSMFGLKLGPECISISQLYKATQTMCGLQRDNKQLWADVIECHRPLTDEFMRASGEAQCPLPKYVLEPNNTASSIEDVFFNICGLVNGTWSEFFSAGSCIISGSTDPYIMTHSAEVARVKAEHYPELPCDIGKCVLALGLGV